MMRTPISRIVLLACVIGTALTVGGRFARLSPAFAADPAPGKEYLAVFSRESGDRQPFAIIEKPAGLPIGDGSRVEIQAFALRVAPIDSAHAQAFLERLPLLDADESQKLPPGFRVYADKGSVQVSYAGASQKYKLTFIDPADVAGQGGNGASGGGGGGSM